MLWAYSWLFAQGELLAGLRRPYVVQGTEPGSISIFPLQSLNFSASVNRLCPVYCTLAICVCVCVCDTTVVLRGLLPVLCSEIIPGRVGEPYRMLEIEDGLAKCKANSLFAVLLFQLFLSFSFLFFEGPRFHQNLGSM